MVLGPKGPPGFGAALGPVEDGAMAAQQEGGTDERVLRALAEAAWVENAGGPYDEWLGAVQRLIDADGSFNGFDLDRLFLVDPEMAVAVAELVIGDESLPVAERVDVARRVRAQLQGPQELSWTIREAGLFPPGSTERDHAATTARRLALRSFGHDPDAVLQTVFDLVTLESGASIDGRVTDDVLSIPLHELADPRTRATLAAVLLGQGDVAGGQAVASRAFDCIDSPESWGISASTAAAAASILVGTDLGRLAPVEDEHPARAAWRAAMLASLAEDAAEAREHLRQGRAQIGERASEPGVRESWLVGLQSGLTYAEGDVAHVVGTALVEERCAGDVVIDDPDVAIAFAQDCEPYVDPSDGLRVDLLAQQRLEALAHGVDLAPSLPNLRALHEAVEGEVRRTGVEALRRKLDLIGADGLEDGRIGWNTVHAVVAEMSAEEAERLGEPSVEMRNEAMVRYGAACLFGSLEDSVVMGSSLRADREQISTAALQELVREGSVDFAPHIVARLDRLFSPALGMEIDAPPDRRTVCSALVARAAALDCAAADALRSTSGAERNAGEVQVDWSQVEMVLEQLEQRGEALGGKLSHELLNTPLLQDPGLDSDARWSIAYRYSEQASAMEGSIADGLQRDGGSASWPWVAGALLFYDEARHSELAQLRAHVERDTTESAFMAEVGLDALFDDLVPPNLELDRTGGAGLDDASGMRRATPLTPDGDLPELMDPLGADRAADEIEPDIDRFDRGDFGRDL